MKSILALSALLVAASVAFAFDDKKVLSDNQVEFKISGMTYDGCADKVEKAIQSDKMVSDVEVDWEKGLAVVTFKEKMHPGSYLEFFSRIEKVGYKLEHIKDSKGDTWTMTIMCCTPVVCKVR